MKIARNSLFYIVTVSIFVVLMWVILDGGKQLQTNVRTAPSITTTVQTAVNQPAESSQSGSFDAIINITQNPLAILILQIIVILILSRLFAYFSQKIKQPSVIGEIIAGIVLGPSVLGALFPGIFTFIFPQSSIETLHFLSQIGLILFMFIVGMELDVNVLKRSVGTAIMVSQQPTL